MFGQIVYILKACAPPPPLPFFSIALVTVFSMAVVALTTSMLMRKKGSKLTEVLILFIFYCRYNIVKIQTSGTHQDVC